MSAGLTSRWRAELQQRENHNLYRRRRVVESPQAAEINFDGRRLLNFCSNDYLGLASHSEVVAALQEGAADWGVGAGAAHLVNGHTSAHHALEEELAAFTGRERALLFSTGYMANMGVINALTEPGDVVFEDQLNHASLLDGGWLSRADMRRYPHVDLETLDAMLAEPRAGAAVIATDGVFSMDGELAPLTALVATAKCHDATLLVDDAHGLGVIGAQGGGCCEQFGLTTDDVPVLIGTLGKGFGTFGAFCAGSNELIEFLIQRARTYIYTTAMPAAVAEATRVSLRLAQQDTWRREKLANLVEQFRAGAGQLGLALLDSVSPIQPIMVGDAEKTLRASAALEQAGVLVTAIRPPTVPDGTARLRVTLTANHSAAQVDQLLAALESAA